MLSWPVSCACDTCAAGGTCAARVHDANTFDIASRKAPEAAAVPSTSAAAASKAAAATVSPPVALRPLVVPRLNQTVSAIYGDDWYVGKVITTSCEPLSDDDDDDSRDRLTIEFMEWSDPRPFLRFAKQPLYERADVLKTDVLCLVDVAVVGTSGRKFRISSDELQLASSLFDERMDACRVVTLLTMRRGRGLLFVVGPRSGHFVVVGSLRSGLLF